MTFLARLPVGLSIAMTALHTAAGAMGGSHPVLVPITGAIVASGISIPQAITVAQAKSPPRALPPKGSLRININTASELELQSLPGVGPALAERIVLGRPYKIVAQLARVTGISSKMVVELRPLLTVNDATGPAPAARR